MGTGEKSRRCGDSRCQIEAFICGGMAEDPCHTHISTKVAAGTIVGPAVLSCQVLGCPADLSQLRTYHQRYRICDDHLKVGSLLMGDGKTHRFCQQCGRFQLLQEFDGEKRSCRARLARHNARRRKNEGLRPKKKTMKGAMVRSKSLTLHDLKKPYGASSPSPPSASCSDIQDASPGSHFGAICETRPASLALKTYLLEAGFNRLCFPLFSGKPIDAPLSR